MDFTRVVFIGTILITGFSVKGGGPGSPSKTVVSEARKATLKDQRALAVLSESQVPKTRVRAPRPNAQ